MEFIFSWITDFDYEETTFTFSYNISLESDRWFLIGFPNRDTLFGADYCLYQNGKFIVSLFFITFDIIYMNISSFRMDI